MSEIVINLNDAQKYKILKKLNRVCDAIVVDRDDLIDMVRYLSPEKTPQICIDFDEQQEAQIRKQFPDKECDFAVIDRSELVNLTKYMGPPIWPR